MKISSNIIWILGGDQNSRDMKNIWRSSAALPADIKKEDTNHLITYHPSGAKIASDYVNEEWLDIDMFQSGHSSLTKEYQYPEKHRKQNLSKAGDKWRSAL